MTTLPLNSDVSVPPAAPNKEELERQQIELTNKKLEIETLRLQYEEKWWAKLIRNVIAFGGVVAVAASAYGI